VYGQSDGPYTRRPMGPIPDSHGTLPSRVTRDYHPQIHGDTTRSPPADYHPRSTGRLPPANAPASTHANARPYHPTNARGLPPANARAVPSGQHGGTTRNATGPFPSGMHEAKSSAVPTASSTSKSTATRPLMHGPFQPGREPYMHVQPACTALQNRASKEPSSQHCTACRSTNRSTGHESRSMAIGGCPLWSHAPILLTGWPPRAAGGQFRFTGRGTQLAKTNNKRASERSPHRVSLSDQNWSSPASGSDPFGAVECREPTTLRTGDEVIQRSPTGRRWRAERGDRRMMPRFSERSRRDAHVVNGIPRLHTARSSGFVVSNTTIRCRSTVLRSRRDGSAGLSRCSDAGIEGRAAKDGPTRCPSLFIQCCQAV